MDIDRFYLDLSLRVRVIVFAQQELLTQFFVLSLQTFQFLLILELHLHQFVLHGVDFLLGFL
jgi:hypothetical protein